MKKLKVVVAIFISFLMLQGLFFTPTIGIDKIDFSSNSLSENFILTKNDIPNLLKNVIKNDGIDIKSVREDDKLYSVTYEDETGKIFSKVFAEAIKYIDDDNEIKFIDTDIIKTKNADFEYQNVSNIITTKFSTDLQKGINISDKNTSISMSVFNNKSNIDGLILSDGNIFTKNPNNLQTKVKGELISDLENKFIYKNAFGENTQLEYTNTLCGVKEEIILNNTPNTNKFSFLFDVGDLVPILIENDKILLIVDKNTDLEDIQEEDIKYYCFSLYVYDSYQLPDGVECDESENPYRHYTEDCYYGLEQLDYGKYILTSVISEEFLNNPETVYPVVIDPSISAANTASNIDDTYTSSAIPTTNNYLKAYLRIGRSGSSSLGDGIGYYYSFLRYINLPQLPPNASISDAKLKLTFRSGQTTAQNATIYRMNSSWNGNGLTHTAGLALSWTQPIHSNVSHNSCSYYNFTVTESIQKWYNSNSNNTGIGNIDGKNNNYGWRITYANPDYMYDINALHSSDNGTVANIPQLTIEYTVTGSTTSPKTISDGTYYIRNLNSNMYLNVLNSGTTNGTSVVQYSFNGSTSQQWKVKYESDGYYSLRPMHISSQTKTIDMNNVTDANTNGTPAKIYEYSIGYEEQKFIISSAVDGGYQIGTKASNGNKVLEVQNSSSANNAIVQIWNYSTTRNNDNWYFESTTNTSFSTASNISLNGSTTVNITEAKQKKYYTFTAPITGYYSITSSNRGTSDPIAWLYNSSETQIDSNDDFCSGERDFQLLYKLTAGQRYYIATGCFSTGTGSYNLKVINTIPSNAYYTDWTGLPNRTANIQLLGSTTTNSTWKPLIENSRDLWNSSRAGTNINLTTTSSTYTLEVAAFAWTSLGQTAPTGTSATIEINTNTISSDSKERQSTIAHEIGHLFWLNDNPTTSELCLMSYSRDRSKIIGPQQIDVFYVINKYAS
jgi:hypothetical protein